MGFYFEGFDFTVVQNLADAAQGARIIRKIKHKTRQRTQIRLTGRNGCGKWARNLDDIGVKMDNRCREAASRKPQVFAKDKSEMVTRKLGTFVLGLLVVCVCSLAQAALPSEYVFTSINVPGAQITMAEGINDFGHVVGTSRIDIFDPESSGFLLADGVFSPITIPGARSTVPQGINKHGSIVGIVFGPSGQKGFLSDHGAFTVFDVPLSTGVCLTSAYTINNSGQIVGEYLDRCEVGNRQHGFLYAEGEFTSIDFPGALGTVANGINNQGHMVGTFSSTVLGFGSFIYVDGQFIELEVPSAFITVALAINKAGQIAGFYF